MSTTHTATTDVDQCQQVEWAEPLSVVATRPTRTLRHTLQRGMVTAEYAVGILAAIALAMVLLRVFNNPLVSDSMLQQVTKLIGQIGAQIK